MVGQRWIMAAALCWSFGCKHDQPPLSPPKPPPAEIAKPPQGTSYYAVKDIDSGFPAAGVLKPGDILLKLNGTDIYYRYAGEPRDWLPRLVNQSGGAPIVVTVLRDEQLAEFEIRAVLDENVENEDGSPSYRLGIVFEYVDYLPMHAPPVWQ